MNTETLEYKGYKITVAQNESPENPFEAWDCEPPLLTYFGDGYAKSYQGAPETIGNVVRLLPDSFFDRGNRVAFLKEFILPLGISMRDFAEERRRVGDIEAIAETLIGSFGSKPDGWGDAIEWFEMAESLLKWAGIECLNTQSNGYCQGDSTLVLAIATPEFLNVTGVQPEHVKGCLQSAVDLYSAWAWGDVYGVSEIHAPGIPDEDGDETEGDELPDGSCWGFYGRNHEESGLMDHARSIIDCHLEDVAETAINEPACLI